MGTTKIVELTNIELNKMNQQCFDFIRQYTTIECIIDPYEPGSFWNGISTIGNLIIINLEEAHPGDILHEAGHIATMPMSSRTWIPHDMDFMPELAELVFDTGMPYGCDIAATGWAYAACLFLNLPTMLPFESGYDEKEKYHLMCERSTGIFGTPLKKLGLINANKSMWKMESWDINLL